MKNLYKEFILQSKQAEDFKEEIERKLKTDLELKTGVSEWKMKIEYIPHYKEISIIMDLSNTYVFEEEDAIPTEIIGAITEVVGTNGVFSYISNHLYMKIKYSDCL